MLMAPRPRSTSSQINARNSDLRAPVAGIVCSRIAATGWYDTSRSARRCVSATLGGYGEAWGTGGKVASSQGALAIKRQRRA
jgi:hypothetical protein